MICQRLIREWETASRDLGFEITVPFTVNVGSIMVDACFLVRYFGGSEGTLIVTEYKKVADIWKKLGDLGYGFSVLDEPETPSYNRDVFIEMLSEWGWTGPDHLKPQWLMPQSTE